MHKFKQAKPSESRHNNSTYTDEFRETFLVMFLDGATSDFYFSFYTSLSTHTIANLRIKKSKQLCVKSFGASYQNHA